jgi:hypothetical protein
MNIHQLLTNPFHDWNGNCIANHFVTLAIRDLQALTAPTGVIIRESLQTLMF